MEDNLFIWGVDLKTKGNMAWNLYRGKFFAVVKEALDCVDELEDIELLMNMMIKQVEAYSFFKLTDEQYKARALQVNKELCDMENFYKIREKWEQLGT